MGLSPRVRGSPELVNLPRGSDGSIPACAGQPHRSITTQYTTRVYPRVCGAAGWVIGMHLGDAGLSPRVRGSPKIKTKLPTSTGSIPACAGQPLRWAEISCW